MSPRHAQHVPCPPVMTTSSARLAEQRKHAGSSDKSVQYHVTDVSTVQVPLTSAHTLLLASCTPLQYQGESPVQYTNAPCACTRLSFMRLSDYLPQLPTMTRGRERVTHARSTKGSRQRQQLLVNTRIHPVMMHEGRNGLQRVQTKRRLKYLRTPTSCSFMPV